MAAFTPKGKVSLRKLRRDPLLLEWQMIDGTWNGSASSTATDPYRELAEKGLQETPDRYFYIPGTLQKIRVSYYEGVVTDLRKPENKPETD